MGIDLINFLMKEFELYENRPTQDNFHTKIDNWVKVNDIEVAINYVSYNQINDDIRYKDCNFTGLTDYKEFNFKNQYKISDKDNNYLIKEINLISRYTILTLQSVV